VLAVRRALVRELAWLSSVLTLSRHPSSAVSTTVAVAGDD
jgi:hypothetical protein